jgi:hypothetical protein
MTIPYLHHLHHHRQMKMDIRMDLVVLLGILGVGKCCKGPVSGLVECSLVARVILDTAMKIFPTVKFTQL